MAGTQRYWDGAKWTDHVAPVAAQPAFRPRPDNGAVIGACVLGVILPLVGFIWGIVLVARDEPKGWLPMAVSVAAFAFWFLLLTAASQPTYY